MKLKKMFSLLLMSTMILATFPLTASAAPITLKIDGKAVSSSFAPVTKSGTTLVPLKVIAENLGAEVSWNASSRQATIKTAANTIVFTVGSKSYTVNGSSKTLTAAPEIISGATMVPIRAIGEAMGAKIDYNTGTSTVTVDYFTTMSGSVKITGSTTLQPVAQAAADKLNGMNKGLTISVAGGGSGAGIKDSVAGTNNLGMS